MKNYIKKLAAVAALFLSFAFVGTSNPTIAAPSDTPKFEPTWHYNCYPVYDYWGYYLYDDCYWEYY